MSRKPFTYNYRFSNTIEFFGSMVIFIAGCKFLTILKSVGESHIREPSSMYNLDNFSFILELSCEKLLR